MDKLLFMLQSAFWIMIFGIVIVFVFLSLLIFMMKVSQKIVSFFIKKYNLENQQVKKVIKNVIEKDEKGEFAAIGLAVKKFQEDNKGE